MSSTQVELTETYQNSILENTNDEQEKLVFTKFSTISLRKNCYRSNYIPSFASSAISLSIGTVTYNGSINVDTNGTRSEKFSGIYDRAEFNKKLKEFVG